MICGTVFWHVDWQDVLPWLLPIPFLPAALFPKRQNMEDRTYSRSTVSEGGWEKCTPGDTVLVLSPHQHTLLNLHRPCTLTCLTLLMGLHNLCPECQHLHYAAINVRKIRNLCKVNATSNQNACRGKNKYKRTIGKSKNSVPASALPVLVYTQSQRLHIYAHIFGTIRETNNVLSSKSCMNTREKWHCVQRPGCAIQELIWRMSLANW